MTQLEPTFGPFQLNSKFCFIYYSFAYYELLVKYNTYTTIVYNPLSSYEHTHFWIGVYILNELLEARLPCHW